MKPKKVKAFYNHNCGWAWACPVHDKRKYDGTFTPIKAVKAVQGQLGVCDECYPDILGGSMVEVRPGVFVPGVDVNKREAALAQAILDNRAYHIVFPRDKNKIMEALRLRDRENMNWIPGESLQDILDENKAHGVK